MSTPAYFTSPNYVPAPAHAFAIPIPFLPPHQSETTTMRANALPEATNVDGVGVLTYQRAIDIARSTEGDLDPSVSQFLETALREIWNRILHQANSYIMTKDEFAVFNFYARRFDQQSAAEEAVARYWRHAGQGGGPGAH